MLQHAPLYAYIPAKDISRAREFYERTLGFKPTREVAGGVMYECGGGTGCFLYPTPKTGTSKARQAVWPGGDLGGEGGALGGRGGRVVGYDLAGGAAKD